MKGNKLKINLTNVVVITISGLLIGLIECLLPLSFVIAQGEISEVISVGDNPQALAFDGEHIWVANTGDNTVMKLNVDCELLSTIDVGNAPIELLYAWNSIWVVNGGDYSITKFRASDGYLEGTFELDGIPVALTFDGNSVWVAIPRLLGSTSTLIELDRWGNILATYDFNGFAWDLLYDNDSLWVANSLFGEVAKVDPSNGLTTSTYGVGTNPCALAKDGDSIWVANCGDDTVTKLLAGK